MLNCVPDDEAAPATSGGDLCGSSSTSPPTDRSSSSQELPWLMVERVDMVPCELALPKGCLGCEAARWPWWPLRWWPFVPLEATGSE